MIRQLEQQIVDIRYKGQVITLMYQGETLIWSEAVVDFMLRATTDGGTIEREEAEIVADLNI